MINHFEPNMERLKAKIRWAEPKRLRLPMRGVHIAPARFGNEDPDTDERWSVKIEFDGDPATLPVATGWASFLTEDAPFRYLVAGVTFTLYEGIHDTALVEIMDAS